MDDHALHIRLVAGDLDALAELYDLHSPFVYGVALRVTGSEGLAETITQELFAHLWEQPGQFDPALGSLRGWLVSRSLHDAATRIEVG
ncbi:RNA polymerase sigma factor [Nonomuraea soli]|uniref:DNA-directed RNA polymerase specialized sigma24 family protein n=1 Tax=Nonomuraea soli TaxID=1032476 RepID=A0A7W0CDT0_9ACTN|nr:sigma factor [Nonomuraea soli]MBA2889308.1 DNA-directed RNA polymerase specialized sigma24 family protein [Nonomuraea soli]